MKRQNRGLLFWAFLVGLVALSMHAQVFQLSAPRMETNGMFHVSFTSDVNHYYILRSASSPTTLTQALSMRLGTNGTMSFTQSTAGTISRFFRVQKVSIATPFDTDNDGIDDLWELNYRRSGAALNPADANEDQNNDGRPDLEEFRAQLLPATASFATANSQAMEVAGNVGVEVRFSKPYSGSLRFRLSGTALEGRDYQPGFSKLAGDAITGVIAVNNTTATIPFTLLTNDFIDATRSVVISIQQIADTNSYRLGAITTHVLSIQEGDQGVYGGVVIFTNDVLTAAQPLKFALRSGASNGLAFFDTSGATLFGRRPFTIPVQFSGTEFTPLGDAAGTTSSEVFGQPLAWRLELQPSFGTNSITAGVTLRLSGFSASSREIVARGRLSAVRLDATP